MPGICREKNNTMKHLLALFLLVAVAAHAQPTNSIKLEWDPNTETNLAGYLVYYGTASGGYSASNRLGVVTNTTVAGLAGDRTYYFALTAYDTKGLESDFSNEVSWKAGPQKGIPDLAVKRLPGVTNAFVLSWPRSDEPGVVGYTIRTGTNTGTAYRSDTTTNNFAVIGPLTLGTAYFFTIAAVDGQGREGPRSADLARIFRWPASPGGLRPR